MYPNRELHSVIEVQVNNQKELEDKSTELAPLKDYFWCQATRKEYLDYISSKP